MGIGEIATVTGRPEGTVKADVHRGLARLRQTIEEET
jgi:DNA-directed RNA polymerase specialized sigma24 family protein